MLKRKTLKTLTRLFTRGLGALLPPPARKRPPKRPVKRLVQRTATKAVRPAKATAATRLAKTPSAVAVRALERTTAGGRWVTGVALAPSGKRRYRLFLPADLATGARIPLVVMLHGCDQNAARFAASTRMHQVAARAGFAVLYPEQDRLANPNGCWNWYETRTGRASAEVGLILQAIEQVCTLYGTDRARVAIAGMSAGAGMAALVAARYPQRFCAVAMHSGVGPGTADSTLGALTAMAGHGSTATPAVDAADRDHWPALLVIQGGADHVVAPRNGPAAAQAWAQATGARAMPARQVQRGKRYPMQVTDYRLGKRTVASLVEIPALGHAWSGGAASQKYGDARGPDASRLVWAFAERHF